MYYTHPCSYCAKIFYVYHDSKEQAAKILYYGIKKHLVEWNEDHKEYQFDDGPQIDINEVYYAIVELADPPAGGYVLS